MPTQHWQQIQVAQLPEARRKLGILDPAIRTWFVSTSTRTITNTVAETSMFGAGVGTLTFPADTLLAGRTIHLELFGVHTMDATPPDITFRVKLGGTTLATVDYTDLNDTDRYFELKFTMSCRATGASGSVIGQGRIIMAEMTDSVDIYELLMSSPATVNTTTDLTLAVTAQPDVADPNSNIAITNALVAILS